jgi:hypothetical protein
MFEKVGVVEVPAFSMQSEEALRQIDTARAGT